MSDVLAQARRGAMATGWALLTLLLAYAAAVHHGIGPVRNPESFRWYEPRGFLVRWNATDWLTEDLWVALVGFGLPALGLAVIVWVTTRSAVAKLLAVWAVLVVELCLYYGIEAGGIWRFFHWRGSAVLVLLALAAGAALTTPWLAQSWERRSWVMRLLVYVPVVVVVLGFMRNATGTDQALRFAISPWPVVPVFGLELLVPLVGAAYAAFAFGRMLGGPRRRHLGLLLGVLTAVALLAGLGAALRRDALALNEWQIAALALCVAGAVLVQASASGAPDPPGRRAALGALLGTAPVLLGLAVVERDYAYTRDYRASQVTVALEAYVEQRDEYPETLDTLVEVGLITSVPRPRVGFRWLHDPVFVYQNFGVSYLLEFSSPRWVQCTYNPPYLDEEEYGDEEWDEQDSADEDLPGSWSCPSKPPELW